MRLGKPSGSAETSAKEASGAPANPPACRGRCRRPCSAAAVDHAGDVVDDMPRRPERVRPARDSQAPAPAAVLRPELEVRGCPGAGGRGRSRSGTPARRAARASRPAAATPGRRSRRRRARGSAAAAPARPRLTCCLAPAARRPARAGPASAGPACCQRPRQGVRRPAPVRPGVLRRFRLGHALRQHRPARIGVVAVAGPMVARHQHLRPGVILRPQLRVLPRRRTGCTAPATSATSPATRISASPDLANM